MMYPQWLSESDVLVNVSANAFAVGVTFVLISFVPAGYLSTSATRPRWLPCSRYFALPSLLKFTSYDLLLNSSQV